MSWTELQEIEECLYLYLEGAHGSKETEAKAAGSDLR